MTQAEYNAALSGLSRALGLGDEADTARLTDVLCAAEESILRYLNRAMLGLGLRRVYSSPDGYESAGEGAYTKTFRFGRMVDKRFFCETADK